MAAPSAPAARPAIHVLIVDQRLAFRDALATRLQTEPDLAVVAKAQSAKFAPRVLVGRSADVILLDADLPDDSAIAFCSDLTRSGDQARVVGAEGRVGRASSPRHPRRCPRRHLDTPARARRGAEPAHRGSRPPSRLR